MDERPASVSAHVVRYDVRGWNLARSLAPFAILASIVARRFPNRWPIALPAILLLIASITLFVRARRSYGWRALELGHHALRCADAGLELSRQNIRQWTLVGRTARLYGRSFSYKLRVALGEREPLAAALQRVLGRATPLKRRGSVRGRIIAACVCALGLGCLAAAIALNLVQLLFVAVPAAIIGFATYMALSQRIAAD